MEKRHFILTEETKINFLGIKLHRIRCTESFTYMGKTINKDDLGGWVEKEENIQEDIWIYGGRIYGDARIQNSNDYCVFQSFGS